MQLDDKLTTFDDSLLATLACPPPSSGHQVTPGPTCKPCPNAGTIVSSSPLPTTLVEHRPTQREATPPGDTQALHFEQPTAAGEP